MKVNLLFPAIVGFVGSVFTLAVFYTEYSLLDVNLSLAFAELQKWPWFWLSTAITTISCTTPFFLNFIHNGEERKIKESGATYALGLLWLPLILVYPGAKELNVLSDDVAGFAMSGICVIQYIVTKLVTRQILRSNTNRSSSQSSAN